MKKSAKKTPKTLKIKIIIGAITIGSLMALIGFVLNFYTLIDVYSITATCPNMGECATNLTNDLSARAELARYLMFGGIALSGIGFFILALPISKKNDSSDELI